jgi:hypothetical protein
VVLHPGNSRASPAVAFAVTYDPETFDDQGNYVNAAEPPFRRLGAALAPDDAPVPPR